MCKPTHKPKLTVKSQLLLFTLGLLVMLGITLFFTLTAVSKSVLSDLVPLFMMEPVTSTIPKVDYQEPGPNTVVIIEPESVQADAINNLVSRLSSYFAVIIAVTMIIAFIGALWISQLITEPIVELTDMISTPADQLSLTELQSTPHHLESSNLQEAVKERLERFQDLFRRQNEFVMDTAHELRSTVAAIRMNLDVAMQEKDNLQPELIKTFDVLDRSTSRMENLLSQLRMLMNGEATLEPALINVYECVEECKALLVDKAAEKDVRLLSFVTTGVYLSSDPLFVQTILVNLIDNAIKYNRSGGKVEIYTVNDKDGCEFIIEDTGIGIPQEEVAHIFDRFYRVDKTRSRKSGGNGLGLSITRALVERAQGKVEVQSELERGTRVKIFLPNLFNESIVKSIEFKE